MRSYFQLALAGVIGLGVYGASRNWNAVHSYIPQFVVSALGPLLPAPAASSGDAAQARPTGNSAGGGQAPVVEVLPAKVGIITEIAEAVGTTRAFESVQINAKLSGIVEAISFEEGATVKVGDELLRIDSAERKADLQAAKAAITQEEAKRNELKTKLDRALQLRRSGAGTEAAVDDLSAQVKTSDSSIQNAIAKERAFAARLNDSIVRAPFSGRVGIRHVELADHQIGQLREAVHEVLEIRRGEGPRIVRRKQLGRDFPVRSLRRCEADLHRPRFLALHPHERRRHVHARVCCIDAHVRAVGRVAEDFVDDTNGAVVTGDAPDVDVGTICRELRALAVKHLGGKNVLRKFVHGVAAR